LPPPFGHNKTALSCPAWEQKSAACSKYLIISTKSSLSAVKNQYNLAFKKYRYPTLAFDRDGFKAMIAEVDELIKKLYEENATGKIPDKHFNFIGCFVPPKPDVVFTAEEEAKAQKALAARNREREQNKLRMRRGMEAQRAARKTDQVSSPAG